VQPAERVDLLTVGVVFGPVFRLFCRQTRFGADSVVRARPRTRLHADVPNLHLQQLDRLLIA
jgi:hypothetical protein